MKSGFYDTIDIIIRNLAAAKAPCVTTSFQAGGVVLLHLLRRYVPGIPVLFVDTLHHFEETCRYRDALAARWRLNLVNLRTAEPRLGLWQVDTDACCARHKVAPLFAALDAYDAWFTALRRDQSPSRADLTHEERFQLPSGHALRKVSPLASWTGRDVSAYAHDHAIPLLPLYAQGHTSIGCAPCTSQPLDASNLRSGRWQGEKLECGIHVRPPAGPAVTVA